MRRTLSCKELVELITDYLEDALSRGDRKRFEAHLSGCEGCRRYLDQMRRTIRATGTLVEDDIAEPAKRELLEAFRSWKRSKSS